MKSKTLLTVIIAILFFTSCTHIIKQVSNASAPHYTEQQINDVRCMAYDSTVSPNEQLRDEHNETLILENRVVIEKKKFKGLYSQYEADSANLSFKNEVELSRINNNTIADLMEHGVSFKQAKHMIDSARHDTSSHKISSAITNH